WKVSSSPRSDLATVWTGKDQISPSGVAFRERGCASEISVEKKESAGSPMGFQRYDTRRRPLASKVRRFSTRERSSVFIGRQTISTALPDTVTSAFIGARAQARTGR